MGLHAYVPCRLIHWSLVRTHIEQRSATHTLRPVTLKQLAEASQEHSDADWKIGDVEISQVRVSVAKGTLAEQPF